jgi:hypothetical protein
MITTTALALSLLATLALGLFLLDKASLVSAMKAQGKAGDEAAARFSRQCSNRTISGEYSYTAQGTILPGSPLPVPPGPFASIGKVTLDGEGNITQHITNDNFNGLLLPPTNYTGTYAVDENCGGTALLVGRAPYKFTIADNGKEIYFMLDAPGTVVTGTAKRQ